MVKFFIATSFIMLIVATLFTLLLVSGKNDVATTSNTPKIMSGPAVPLASEIVWKASFDANPDAVQDLSLSRDK